ncbi:hypothetical protein J2I47_19455 [Fibrella sp. HMF5335]|uniref:Uncharacterized protein n=1 Tax=Fibrella rubiginis TaxID=2817060 RepID=A0A939K308_9BACT|nr:hypothetical protein [Fibrella rubiginis]MBO0938737.1 hypothetical protein [Fibrella rubiginis]
MNQMSVPAFSLSTTYNGPPRSLQMWVLIGLYSLFTGIFISRHEPWRDELHTWLIVLQSHSVGELHLNKVYEGHPDLWYLLLFAIKQFTSNFVYVQLAHWLLSIGAMIILVRFAPFPLYIKALLLFGYFFGFEYAIISRNYAIGVLLLFLCCSLVPYRSTPWGYIGLSLTLALLCQASALAALLGCALFGIVLLDLLLHDAASLAARWPRYVLGSLIVLGGLALCYLSIHPPTDGTVGLTGAKPTINDFLKSTSALWNAFVPVPTLTPFFWNANLLDFIADSYKQSLLKSVLSVGIVVFLILPLLRSRLALIGWSGASMLMLTLFFTQYLGVLRHHGHFFLGFVCFLWIQPSLGDYNVNRPGRLVRIAVLAWPVVLTVQLSTFLYAAYQDIRRPFTMTRQVADFLLSPAYRNWFRAGAPDSSVEGVASYLPANRMYYPCSARQGGFVKWNNNYSSLSLPQMVDSIRKHQVGPAVLLLAYKPHGHEVDSLGLVPMRVFTGSIVFDEQFWLYQVK